MKALIVGADHITTIREEIARVASRVGITRTEHWSGRKVADVRRALPGGTGLVVVICDRVNHKLLHSVRKQADKRALPVLYTHHSLIDVREKLAALFAAPTGD